MTATITIGGHILRPGLLTLPPGTERHVIDGGTMLVLRLAAGDGLRIVDSEGGQTAQIAAFGKNGKCDAGLLNATDHKTKDGYKIVMTRVLPPLCATANRRHLRSTRTATIAKLARFYFAPSKITFAHRR